MITINITNPDRGRSKEFADEASAIVWIQDEIARWENALGPKLMENAGAYIEPLLAWRHAKDDVDGMRRRNRGRTGSADFALDDDDRKLVEVSSKYGRTLLYVLKNLGRASADAAAVYYRIAQGEVDWNDDAQFRGIMLFETIYRAHKDFELRDEESAQNIKADNISDRVNELTESIRKIDEMISSVASAAAQQRSQIDAELTTYKAEAIEKWRKLRGEAETLEASAKSALSASESELTSATQAAKTTIDNWLAARGEQRQLEKPAELWAERGRTHLESSNRWRRWTIVVGLGGLLLAVFVAVLAFWSAKPLFEAAIIAPTAASAKANAGTLRPTFHYELIFTGAITLAWLTMYLWAMRILVRLYTTEHHLAIDASARSAMMEAYLGLIEANAANATDRPIVFEALFRPVQDGMVRDDGPPGITPAALLSSIASAKGGNS